MSQMQASVHFSPLPKAISYSDADSGNECHNLLSRWKSQSSFLDRRFSAAQHCDNASTIDALSGTGSGFCYFLRLLGGYADD